MWIMAENGESRHCRFRYFVSVLLQLVSLAKLSILYPVISVSWNFSFFSKNPPLKLGPFCFFLFPFFLSCSTSLNSSVLLIFTNFPLLMREPAVSRTRDSFVSLPISLTLVRIRAHMCVDFACVCGAKTIRV